MDARELTKKVYELENINAEFKKRIEFLEQSNLKLVMQVNDLVVDVKM